MPRRRFREAHEGRTPSERTGAGMDLKVYYRKIRELESEITESDVVVVSLETPDGGRSGEASEVPKLLAAKLVVQGKARLASADEAARYRGSLREASVRAQEAAAARLGMGFIGEPRSQQRKPAKTK